MFICWWGIIRIKEKLLGWLLSFSLGNMGLGLYR